MVTSICLTISIGVLIFAPTISSWMGDIQLTPMIRMASIALIPLVFISMVRGYYQMKHQMNTIAISQVIDQVLRVIVIFIAISVFMYMDVSIYQAGTIAISGSVIGLLALFYIFI